MADPSRSNPDGSDQSAAGSEPAAPLFFFDLGSPYAWLIAERIGNLMPTAIWQPVCAGDISNEPLWDGDRERVEHLADMLGLLPPRWPENDFPDTHRAMLVATFAKSIGRTASFALAAFRQAWTGGRDLSETDTLIIAAAACELHPRAIMQALELDSVREQLDTSAALTRLHYFKALPAVKRDNELLTADQLLTMLVDGYVPHDS